MLDSSLNSHFPTIPMSSPSEILASLTWKYILNPPTSHLTLAVFTYSKPSLLASSNAIGSLFHNLLASSPLAPILIVYNQYNSQNNHQKNMNHITWFPKTRSHHFRIKIKLFTCPTCFIQYLFCPTLQARLLLLFSHTHIQIFFLQWLSQHQRLCTCYSLQPERF